MTAVAILGCGPTGLVAAHAATLSGADVTIFSKARKSHMFGAQYLHQPIPFTDSGEPVMLDYTLKGTAEGYRKKVYGPDSESIKVSPEDYEGSHAAFDIRRAYDFLWEAYGSEVVETNVTTGWLAGSFRAADYDHVISTIPLPQLCIKGHSFPAQKVFVMGDSDKQQVPFPVPDNTVICNGDESPSWYRASNIFGYKTVEWPNGKRRPPLPVAEVNKPVFNTCTCWPNIVRLGRFGMWTKGVLVHHAFMMAMDLMNGDFSADESRSHFAPCPMADPSLSANVAMQLGCRCG